MGKVRKFKDKWGIDIHHDGQRIRKFIGSKKDAQNALTAMQADILRGEFKFKKDSKIKFTDFAEKYIEHKKASRMKSWSRLESCLKHLKPFFKDKYLSKITYRDINEYKQKRIKEKQKRIKEETETKNKEISPATVNRELACLKNMFEFAIKCEYVSENPVKKIKFFPEQKYIMKILTNDEIDKLIGSTKGQLRAIIILALGTGARRNEILTLRWKDIDFEKCFIHFKETKGSIPRKVPMSGLVIETLKSIERVGEYVFQSKRTGTRITDVKKGFKAACDRAEINDCRFHDLRHTAITLMLEAGAPIPTVMEIVGHRDIRTTMRYYHLTPEKSRRAVEILASIVSQNRQDLGSIWATEKDKDVASRLISSN